MGTRYKLGNDGLEFTNGIYEDEFKLVTKPAGQTTARNVLWPLLVWTSTVTGNEFVELTSEMYWNNVAVWMAIIAVLLFSGLTLFIVEGHTNDEVYPEPSISNGLSHHVRDKNHQITKS